MGNSPTPRRVSSSRTPTAIASSRASKAAAPPGVPAGCGSESKATIRTRAPLVTCCRTQSSKFSIARELRPSSVGPDQNGLASRARCDESARACKNSSMKCCSSRGYSIASTTARPESNNLHTSALTKAGASFVPCMSTTKRPRAFETRSKPEIPLHAVAALPDACPATVTQQFTDRPVHPTEAAYVRPISICGPSRKKVARRSWSCTNSILEGSSRRCHRRDGGWMPRRSRNWTSFSSPWARAWDGHEVVDLAVGRWP